MEFPDNADVCLRAESSVRIDCLAVVRVQLAEDVEPVQRHHLLGTASVIISQ